MSTEILLEYEEVIARMNVPGYAARVLHTIEVLDELHHNLRKTDPTYRFHLIIDDADDNKFADCAIAAEADYLITNDGHFQVLIGSGYKPQPITPEEFIRRHLKPL